MYGPPFFFRVIPTYQGLPSLTIPEPIPNTPTRPTIRTNIGLSVGCCILWTVTLALPAIIPALVALICSIMVSFNVVTYCIIVHTIVCKIS